MLLLLGLCAQLQQGAFLGNTTPPSGDTIGYWQQRVGYTIVATLDEPQTRLHARATLVYVNNSPDTLREMFFHQYLNAFRPGSKWSASDEHENRVRFQDLQEPNYGYERFTSAPVVGGTPVVVDYPGSPDSTVAHFKLPVPLAPHDSTIITLEWDARPSTVLRRQGRRGRTWDFAQWYPKVAVYDRGGWEPNALVPAGELYGEYGRYDVTMVVRDDQIIASTGVPVSGDPGWARVSRTGPPFLASNAYADLPPAPQVSVPEGYRAVRFVAENVHMFAWSASPDYRYEGAMYIRQLPPRHFKTWDTVAVNVLYKPGDDSIWGGGRAVDRTIEAAKWLESLWGPYAYPAITNVHRLEPGGTEFPMMIMNGSASIGIILHEFGHVFTYGILGNNEWRSGWMDEGLTDYQTYWAQKLTPQEQIGRFAEPPRLASGYRVDAVTIPRSDSALVGDWMLEVHGRSQPIGTNSADFSEFGIYNAMIYDRARLMYGQLRDVLGDSIFLAFTHDYYNRWALKHVDERAMRASVERVWGHAIGWFFDEWVHGTGLMDYRLGPAVVMSAGGHYATTVQVVRQGELRHPMPVGVLTASGWTIGRADPFADVQNVRIETNAQPQRIELDPYHVTFDWDWRNNIDATWLITIPEPKVVFNWPWLDQSDRRHTIVALAPAAWYSNPEGPVAGIRAKTNYLSTVDIYDAGIALSTRLPADTLGHRANFVNHLNAWVRAENLYLPGMARPLMDWGGGVNFLDGLFKADLFKNWDLSPFIFTPGPTIKARAYATVMVPSDSMLLPEQWSGATLVELGGSASYKTTEFEGGQYALARVSGGVGFATHDQIAEMGSRGYARLTGSIGGVKSIVSDVTQVRVRLFGGIADGAPWERQIFASTQDPFETFNNDLFRPRGALFKQSGINYLPLGGAGLRGFKIGVPLERVVSANGEFVQRLGSARGQWGSAAVSFSIFGDVAGVSSKELGLSGRFLSDAGAGLIVRGRLYDRDVYVRLDAPVFVNHGWLAGGGGLGGHGSVAPRWTITVGDLW